MGNKPTPQLSGIDASQTVWSRLGRTLYPYGYIGPAIIAVFAVVLYPLLQSIVTSFKDYNLIYAQLMTPDFNGLQNYLTILSDGHFWYSLRITSFFTIGCVAGTILVGLAIALLLDQDFKGAYIIGACVLLPWIIPRVASAILWQWMFDSQFGIINYVLTAIGLEHFDQFAWFGNATTALIAVAIVVIWQSFPFIAVSLTAGLKTISTELYEAAEIDGANFLQKVRYISIPMVKHLLTTLIIISTIWDFRVFDQMHVMTGGGPAGSTELLGIYTWRKAFGLMEMGEASAVAVIMFLIVLVVTAIYLKVFLKEEVL